MPAPDDLAWFDADCARFLESGLSISLASRDAGLRPSLAKGLACRALLAERELRLVVDGSHGAQLLHDIDDCGRVAVVLSEVGTHRTVQIKSADVRIEPLDPADEQAVADYRRRFGQALVALGHAQAVVDGVLASRPADRRVVVVRPQEAFEQTPGPQAGRRMESGR